MNAKVLPDPVSAIPIMSLPDMAMGQPWLYMAVGFTKFSCKVKVSVMYLGNLTSSNVEAGRGILSPFTVIWFSSLNLATSNSVLAFTDGCS